MIETSIMKELTAKKINYFREKFHHSVWQGPKYDSNYYTFIFQYNGNNIVFSSTDKYKYSVRIIDTDKLYLRILNTKKRRNPRGGCFDGPRSVKWFCAAEKSWVDLIVMIRLVVISQPVALIFAYLSIFSLAES